MSKLTYERAKQLYTPYDEGQMRHLCALRDVEIDRLRAENAKLRRLARGLNFCTESAHGPRVDCEHCPLGEIEGIGLACETLMRELGLEVDG